MLIRLPVAFLPGDDAVSALLDEYEAKGRERGDKDENTL